MTARLTILTIAAAVVACSLASIAGAGWAPLNGAGFDGRSPDTVDAAKAAHLFAAFKPNHRSSMRDGRSPDTKDAAVAAHQAPSPVIIVGAQGFDWADAGIGAAAGFGLAVVAASGLALTRDRRALPAS
jgi:hypothetical protein